MCFHHYCLPTSHPSHYLLLFVLFFSVGWNDGERIHLGEELSDVLLYLIRLSEKCRVDLPNAALRCLEQKFSIDINRSDTLSQSSCIENFL